MKKIYYLAIIIILIGKNNLIHATQQPCKDRFEKYLLKPGQKCSDASGSFTGQTCKERYNAGALKPNQSCTDASGSFLAEGEPD